MTSNIDLSNPFPPSSLNDFVISDASSRKLLEDVDMGKMPFPFMGKRGICLWGMYGTGKTTLATLLPEWLEQTGRLPTSTRQSFFTSDAYWELHDCRSGNNTVSLLQHISERCQLPNAFSKSGWNYEVLDEVDMLTENAQSSLKA